MTISDMLQSIRSSRNYQNQIAHIEDIPAKEAEYASIELKPLLNFALHQIGIDKLYTHQVEAINQARAGNDIVIVTSTASGKSLSYTIPIFEAIMENPQSTALYISPLNALVNDQFKNFTGFMKELGIDANVSRYVGTMDENEKRNVRYGNSKIILTNPEMVHMSFLPWKHLWKRFLSNLRYIVVDESHYYRGVAGSNMANILRRLNRICEHYGAHPQYICCSATIGNPGKHTGALIGKTVNVIDRDGSGHGNQKFVFWNPPMYFNEEGFNVRKSSFSESLDLFNRFILTGLQTIAFTRARQNVERMYVASRSRLREKGLADKISPYRAGYFGKEREEIEKKLSDGSLSGIISTNALELGIDIGGLDACVIDGYPGTIMNTRQQAGRAGRGNGDSIVALVANSNALDQYYMRYPTEFFESNSEEAVLNASNPYIQAGHVLCAAKEIPLTPKDTAYFGDELQHIIELLEAEGLLTGAESKSCVDANPHMNVSIRGIDTDAYSIFALNGGRRIPIEKDIEKAMAFRECFEGAIYLHKGTPYYVNKIDHDKKEIHVEETQAEYYTKAMMDTEIFIKEKYTEKFLSTCKDVDVGLGDVEVVEKIVSYKKLKYFSETVIGEYPLDIPKLSLETVALWIKLPDRFKDIVENNERDFDGGIHAIEHAMIAMYPLRLLADRNDIGGVSSPSHNDLNEKSGIFVYDGHRGGVGYAERGYEIITDLLEVTLKAIQSCPCNDGCPACIQSPKCGNHNNPLDKHAAIMILHELLGKAKYIPSREKPAKPVDYSKKQPEKPVSIGDALNNVRKQLRKDVIKTTNQPSKCNLHELYLNSILKKTLSLLETENNLSAEIIQKHLLNSNKIAYTDSKAAIQLGIKNGSIIERNGIIFTGKKGRK
ncbi:MAG: ATP-dependent helicase [Methanomicrobiales archaeon HGW-Methanomicrobiales-5]|jgi:DEAD/DEAH box helicase domain-containing protein|nr:MAG: ATP-dependent helicase [Methanomicrobiales archaeon HGW-Methanomicrobiales-5]